MRAFLILVLTWCLTADCSAVSRRINIVGWNASSSSFDTIVSASSGDSLIYINECVTAASFIKFVNGFQVDTLSNIPVGDTIDIHPLIFSDTLITYYVWSQSLNYGLRCHIQYLNVGLYDYELNNAVLFTGTALDIKYPSEVFITVTDMNGKLLVTEIGGGSTSSRIELATFGTGIYVVTIRNRAGIITSRKLAVIE